MKKNKKFIIGLILAIIGVIGISGLPSSDDRFNLFIGSLIFLIPGVILLYLVRKAQYPEVAKDIYGSTTDKKPLQKEWWAWLLVGCFVFGLLCNVGDNDSYNQEPDTDVIAIQENDTDTVSETDTNSQIETETESISNEDSDTNFGSDTDINTESDSSFDEDSDTNTTTEIETETNTDTNIESENETSSKATSSKATSSESESSSEIVSVTPTSHTYVFTINTATNCFHSKECGPSTKISDENRATYTVEAYTLQDAIDYMIGQGYDYCGVCAR